MEAIAAAGGPTYAFIDNTFIGNNVSGGQPGGNIRTAFLYNPARVSQVGAAQTIGDQAAGSPFNGARLPLVASFDFNGETVTVVDNHFSSKGGSGPILGIERDFAVRQEDPTVNGSLDERREQAQAVNDFVDGVLSTNPESNIVVLGDMNEFEFISPLQILSGTIFSTNGGQDTAPGGDTVLTNLIESILEDERYSFIFQGNSQQLDHVLVSDSLLGDAEIDIVHVITEFAESDMRASDHDPVLARFTFNSTPMGEEIVGTSNGDSLVGTEGDERIEGLAGRDIISGGGGEDTIVGGPGIDLLTGGAEGDTFVYERLLDRRDAIVDFEEGIDLIDFSQIFQLQRFGSATPFDDYVRVVQRGVNTAVQIDLNGDLGLRDRFRTFALLENTLASEVTVNNFVV